MDVSFQLKGLVRTSTSVSLLAMSVPHSVEYCSMFNFKELATFLHFSIDDEEAVLWEMPTRPVGNPHINPARTSSHLPDVAIVFHTTYIAFSRDEHPRHNFNEDAMIHPVCRISALICLLFLAAPSLWSQNVTIPDSGIVFTVAAKPWPEGLGSQRAAFDVPMASGAVCFQLPWRRHDPQPDNHRLLLINGTSGDTVRNILRLSVTNEECKFLAGPLTKPGRYLLYYLSYEVQPGWGGYGRNYVPPELPPDSRWLADEHLTPSTAPASIPHAVTRSIEARTAFDSFFPMEVIPTRREKDQFLNANPAQYYVFPEERRNPIRMLDEIPVHWTRREHMPYFEGTAGRNEYFTFQIGVYAYGIDLKNVTVTFGDLLEKNGHRIPAEQFTCFNTRGIDAFGKAFQTALHVRKGSVQPLWIGLDVPAGTVTGSYAGPVVVRCDGAKEEVLLLRLMVRDTLFAE
jgi:hypothetical protein